MNCSAGHAQYQGVALAPTVAMSAKGITPQRHLPSRTNALIFSHMARVAPEKQTRPLPACVFFTDGDRTIMDDKFWKDQFGFVRKVPQILGRLKCGKCPGHAALRNFVIQRDGNKCVKCSSTERLMADHILSRNNGGSHHPNNLQCLCSSCNSRKANLEDRTHA